MLHPGSCGRAIPPVTDVAIIDENWNFLVEPKEVGEIVIKSPANMVGYWNNKKPQKKYSMTMVGLNQEILGI